MPRALALALLLPACGREEATIAPPRPATPEQRVPAEFVGAGTDVHTGLPLGYPPRLPLVPGGRALSGGVDPGVVRTATIVYDGTSVAAYRAALEEAVRANGQHIVDTFEMDNGSVQLRVDLGGSYATVVVTDEQGRVRILVTAMEPRQP